MSKKLVLFALVLMLSLAAGVTVAQDTDLSSVDPSGQTVIYWHQFTEAQGETMTQLVETFNETNEWGITVEMVHQGGYNDIRDQMSAAIISGELPNLVAGYQNDAASYYLDGAAVDLAQYINDPTWGLSEEEMAGFNAALLAANTFTADPFEGEILAFPHQASAQVLVVNMTMLNELGFDAPPQTYEEFVEISCAAAELTGPNGEDIFGFPVSDDASMFESFVASMGGNIFHDNAYDFTSEAAINTFQLYKDLYDQGCAYVPDRPFGNTGDFALGLNPMATTSTAGFTFIMSDFETSGVEAEWVVTTLPWTETRALQVFVPSIVMVPSTPEQQLASWLFLKYLVSPEAAATWSSNTGYFNPVQASNELMTAETFSNQAMFPYFDAANQLINDSSINLYVAPNVVSYGQVRGLISEAIANVTTGGMSVEEAAQSLQEQATEIHEESMAN